MTSEQLQATRAERWRQQANPVLILEDAEAWLQETGLSLFLPRKTQLAAPAPSFVEACVGQTTALPDPADIQNANELLLRLLTSGEAVPLNLLGTVTEQPDFVATPEALSFIFALRGDRDWKSGPKGQSSPLVVEVWKLLDREGALTTVEIQDKLGRELTEAAVLRALTELWNTLRVVPVFEAGQPTHWEPMQARFQKAMHAGGGMSLVTALSSLVTLYLRSAVAATGDEIEVFLSPIASRSRIRDVVRGLIASRQLEVLTQGTQALVYLAGELPEFAEVETPEAAAEEAARRSTYTPRHEGGMRPPYKRPAFITQDKPKRRGPIRPGGEERPKPRWNRPAAAGAGARPAAGGGFKRPYKKREADAPRPSFERPARDAGAPEQRPRKEWKPRPAAGPGERPAFRPRTAGEGRPFTGERRSSSAKPYGKRSDSGERRPFAPRREGAAREGAGESRPYVDRPKRAAGDRPFTSRPSFTDRPKRTEGGERKSYGGRGSGEKRPYAPRRESPGGKPPYTARGPAAGRPAGKPFGDRPARPAGDRPFSDRPRSDRAGSESRPPYRGSSASRERTGPPRERTGAPKKFTRSGPSTGPRSGSSRTEGRFARPSGAGAGRPASGRPSTGRPFSGRPGSDRPGSGRTAGAGPGGRPTGRPSAGRTGFKSSGSRPGGKPGGFKSKPGGFKKRPPSGGKRPE